MSQSPLDSVSEAFELHDDEAGPRSRRTALGVAALAATALAAGAFLLLGGSADDEELGLGTAPGATSEAGASPSAAPVPVPPALPASSVQLGARDPFAPLHTEAQPAAGTAAVSGSGAAAPPAVAPSDGSAVLPVAADPGAPAPSVVDAGGPAVGPQTPAAPDLAAPGSAEASGPRTVLLTRVTGTGSARSAVLSVDGTATTVEVGGSFGPSGELQLVSVQQGPGDGQWTAVLRAGDADPFDVVSGVPSRLP